MKNNLVVRECTHEGYTNVFVQFSHSPTPAPFQQAPYYGSWQEHAGKTVIYFTVEDGDNFVAVGLAVKYDAPGGISFLYSPYGPLVTTWTPELIKAIHDFFRPVCKRLGASFVRIDNETIFRLPNIKPVHKKIAVTASLQPRAEWLLDIKNDQEAIWMGLHKHARYNVRLAERANATFELFTPVQAPVETFISLMKTTAGRDSFGLQNRAYYEAVLKSVPAEHGFVALCTINSAPAAIALFVECDNMIHYVFAGSSNDFRKIAPPYFLIWNSIIEARSRGWLTLNFGGIRDDVKGQHLAGVTSFKKRFGGFEVTHQNPVDLIYKPIRYRAFSIYKQLH